MKLPLGPTGGPPRWNGGGGGPKIPGAGFVDCCNIKGSPLEKRRKHTVHFKPRNCEAFIDKTP